MNPVYEYNLPNFQKFEYKYCSCKTLMRPIYDNVGFDEPNGPIRTEIVGYKCHKCGKKEQL